jgi:hypothetical protein
VGLEAAVSEASVNLGVAEMLPRVTLVCGAHIVDLSDARLPAEMAAAAERALERDDGTALAVLAG